MGGTKVTDYLPNTKLSPEQAKQETSTLPNIRLLDPAVVSPTYQQLQQIRGFYKFPNPLDVDRYPNPADSNALKDTVVAVREINRAACPARPTGSTSTPRLHPRLRLRGRARQPGRRPGRPGLHREEHPADGRARHHRAARSTSASARRRTPSSAGHGARRARLPRRQAARTGQHNISYAGKGGVPVGIPVQPDCCTPPSSSEKNLLLSGRDQRTTRRSCTTARPASGSQKAAPWLKVDGDPYPAVVDGRIIWIVDGYTTSNGYPYSRAHQPGRRHHGHQHREPGVGDRSAGRPHQLHPQLGQGDRRRVRRHGQRCTPGTTEPPGPDPADLEKAFPGTVQPQLGRSRRTCWRTCAIPQDLFKVQRQILARYHVTDAAGLLQRSGLLADPQRPDDARARLEPPYYLTLKMPDQTTPAFSLTSTFVPKGGSRTSRPSWRSTACRRARRTVKIRILQVPAQPVTPGPEQVQNTFETNPTVSQRADAVARTRLERR